MEKYRYETYGTCIDESSMMMNTKLNLKTKSQKFVCVFASAGFRPVGRHLLPEDRAEVQRAAAAVARGHVVGHPAGRQHRGVLCHLGY